ncbi:unnamed protein product, partial [Ascophyllum nodosum]
KRGLVRWPKGPLDGASGKCLRNLLRLAISSEASGLLHKIKDSHLSEVLYYYFNLDSVVTVTLVIPRGWASFVPPSAISIY